MAVSIPIISEFDGKGIERAREAARALREPYRIYGRGLRLRKHVGRRGQLLSARKRQAHGAHDHIVHQESDLRDAVGRFANIAALTRIGPTDHPFRNAAQHHFLYRSASYWDVAEDDAEFFAARAARRCTLGPDCWIGHGAIIKPEVTLGAGAIVASGAVVTKDVAPFMIVAGCPARPIRSRFSPGVSERLLALAWWDWDHDRLRGALEEFRKLPAEEFLDRHGG